MEGWETNELGDVCDVTRGKTITRKTASPGDIPVVAGGLTSPYSHNVANRPEYTTTVSGSGANAGYVNFWPTPIYASDCSTVVTKDPNRLNSVFVFRYMQSQQDYIYKNLKRGAAQPHVYPKDLAKLSIPLPPLPEQERIVAILDEAFAAIETATANAEKNIENARELFESQLERAFSSRDSGDFVMEGWSQQKLGDVCDFIGGSQPPKSTFLTEPGPNTVRLLQIRDFSSDDKAIYIPRELAKRSCNEADIMIARYGASVGQIHRGKSGTYNVALIKTIPDKSHLDIDFFYFYLKSPLFQRPLGIVSDRAAQAGFSKSDIHDFVILLPPLAEQARIAAILDEASKRSKQLEQISTQKIEHLTNLKQSLLHKAFTGELTADKKAADQTLSEAGV